MTTQHMKSSKNEVKMKTSQNKHTKALQDVEEDAKQKRTVPDFSELKVGVGLGEASGGAAVVVVIDDTKDGIGGALVRSPKKLGEETAQHCEITMRFADGVYIKITIVPYNALQPALLPTRLCLPPARGGAYIAGGGVSACGGKRGTVGGDEACGGRRGDRQDSTR
jgi:hypothetical protein